MNPRRKLVLLLTLLGAAHLMIACAGFFAPYDPTTQDRDRPYAPPMRVHMLDAAGHFHLRPFVYAQQLREGVLVPVLDDYTDHSGPLRVLWPSSRQLAPKLRVFVDFLPANLIPVVEGEAETGIGPSGG